MISILQHQMNKQRFKFASSFSFQETSSVHRSSITTPLHNLRHRHYHQSSQVRFSRLHHHLHFSNLSSFYSPPIITRLFSSSSINNGNDNDIDVEESIVSHQQPMENLYREWTLEQDQLLWSKSNASDNNNNKKSNDAAELAVLLGRGIRGVQQRLLKLKDVNSSAYQRLFVETQNNNSGKSQDNEKGDSDNDDKKNNYNKNYNNNNKLIPALEIVRRIEWDYQLNEYEFYIMHYDRVDNAVVTTQLTATNNQISSKETSFIKALPEHRIVAIKYLERIVWDRRQQRKYDIFFTEPGIINVINEYDDWKRNRDEQLKAKRAVQKAWNIRWINLLGEGKSSETNEKVDRLMNLTKDLLRSTINNNSMDNNRSNDNDNNNSEDVITNANANANPPSTSSSTIMMMMKQRIDFYLRSIKGLFNEEDLFSSSSVSTPTLIEENSNNEELVLLLLNELSEWVASPYWFQSILSLNDDDNDDIENNNEEDSGDDDNEYSRLLREILLQKISSTMDRLEGTNKNKKKLVVGKEIHKSIKSKKKQKIVQQQEASNRLASIEIKDKDIEEKFIRGSGSGGQKINKTSSCVSLLHKPTSIRVECQDSRSLDQNRKTARKRLKEKLDLYYNGSQSKQSIKQLDMKKKKQKKKSKNKSRVKEKQLKEQTQNQTNQTQKKKLSKKQQLLLQLVEGKAKEEVDEREGRK